MTSDKRGNEVEGRWWEHEKKWQGENPNKKTKLLPWYFVGLAVFVLYNLVWGD